MEVFRRLRSKKREERRRGGLDLRRVERVLTLYLRGLLGRKVSVRGGGEAYTDTRDVFLPSYLAEFQTEEANFRLYKVMSAHKYGQLKYGRLQEVSGFLNNFRNRRLALDIYGIVENSRIERRLAEEFKGLRRDLKLLREHVWGKRPVIAGMSEKEAAVEALLQKLLLGKIKGSPSGRAMGVVEESAALIREMGGGGLSHSYRVIERIYALVSRLPGSYRAKMEPVGYHGVIKPRDIAGAVRKTREMNGEFDDERPSIGKKPYRSFEKLFINLVDLTSMIRKKPKPPVEQDRRRPVEFKARASKLGRTLGSEGDGTLQNVSRAKGSFRSKLTPRDRMEKFLYHEWDHRLQDYRRNWCVVKEQWAGKGNKAVVDNILDRNSALLKKLRKEFEAIRPEYTRFRGQIDGDDIDLDSFITAYSDLSAGRAPSEKVYTRRREKERSIAVGFLLDSSASTHGWTISVEKEALTLITEALDVLGDRYGIYAFYSNTRRECVFLKAKDFGEHGNGSARARIAGFDAYGYTRMGAPIRHLTRILNAERAKIKLMLIIGDGRPLDYDGYDGDYALEDTRMAIVEAKRRRIHPFFITIDTKAREYIPRMCGRNSYVILDDVARLPRFLPQIYRRLTT